MNSENGDRAATGAAALTALMPVHAYDPGYLREAIDSMLAQTDPDWRLLVIGEPKELPALRAEISADLVDTRIELIANDGRKLAGAFNTGMRRCETPFAAILLADDLWAPEAVEILTRRIDAEPGVDFFHSSRIIVDDQGRPISSVHEAFPRFELDDFFHGSPVKHLLCWRVARGLEVGGMDESLNSVGPDDWDFPWTMAEAGATFAAVSEPLYVYRDHRRCYRLTTHLPLSTQVREIRRILLKHGAEPDQIRERIEFDRSRHLRQCLYDSQFDQLLRRITGSGPRSAWRETYR